jgi:hypothetical protein
VVLELALGVVPVLEKESLSIFRRKSAHMR